MNAISSDKPLTFEEHGLTIIYGDNGSGKSGYARSADSPLTALDALLEKAEAAPKTISELKEEEARLLVGLWAKNRGYDGAGLGYLIEMSKRYYDRRRQEQTLKKGDRVAILGLGIAVVEEVDGKWIQVALWNRVVLRILRKELLWDERNLRQFLSHLKLFLKFDRAVAELARVGRLVSRPPLGRSRHQGRSRAR